MTLITRLLREEEGQSMVETALILALFSIVAAATLPALGTSVSGAFRTVNNGFPAQ